MKKVKLEDIINKKGNNYYIIAETAFSHEGNISYLMKQIDMAEKGGADGIKFQILLNIDESYSKDTEISQNFKKWNISKKDWKKIIEYTKSKKLEILILPIDIDALKFVKDELCNFIDAIEIHSICLNEVPYIKNLIDLKKIIILGIGGRTSKDIDFVLNELKSLDPKLLERIILMYGYQSFPTDYEKLNLLKLGTLKNQYNLTLGYADHTSFKDIRTGNEMIKYSYLLGARIFEKHLITEMGVERIDYQSAIDYKELLILRNEIDSLIKILGNNNINILNDKEQIYRNREKQIAIKKDLKKGEFLTQNMIFYKVSNEKSDFEQKDYYKLINKKILVDIKKNEVLKKKHVNF